MSRNLYLVCYDVANPKRLYRIHKRVQAFAIGGQKSFYECWMTPAELASLRQNLQDEMDATEDRIHFFQLDPRMTPLFYGRALRQSTQPFLIL